ncbi:hypothetical protein Y030_6168 [Burkholderia pseudomallei MSHR332]|nr:hypothetical protein Y030_6168 [Burkholderia pseudomallei MSHR332]
MTPPHAGAPCSTTRRRPHCDANTNVHALTAPPTKRTSAHTQNGLASPIANVSKTVAAKPARTIRAGSAAMRAQVIAPTK